MHHIEVYFYQQSEFGDGADSSNYYNSISISGRVFWTYIHVEIFFWQAFRPVFLCVYFTFWVPILDISIYGVDFVVFLRLFTARSRCDQKTGPERNCQKSRRRKVKETWKKCSMTKIFIFLPHYKKCCYYLVVFTVKKWHVFFAFSGLNDEMSDFALGQWSHEEAYFQL